LLFRRFPADAYRYTFTHILMPLLLLLLVLASPAQAANDLQPDAPVILEVPRWIKGEAGVLHLSQLAAAGIIDLTPTNGFFDRGFVAIEPGPMVPGDKALIGASYGALAPSKSGAHGEARWYLYLAQPGEIRFALRLSVPAAEVGRVWTLRVGGETRQIIGALSDGTSDQPGELVFKMPVTGKVPVVLSYEKPSGPDQSLLRRIRLTGPSVVSAQLLRARWRPAAVHARFSAPTECKQPSLWVFESHAKLATASYAPMTTSFGYFGTVFDARGKIAPGAGFNFSMWVASAGAKGAPSLPEMSRLLGTSLPEATYSTFGHEGTGVKFRNAVAYPTGADRTIQALRAEREGAVCTYHGYFYDEHANCWRLYASAQDYNLKRQGAAAKSGTLPSTGSFCEVPGPPNTERTGDVVRSILRRGWFQGSNGSWHAAVLSDGKDRAQTTGGGDKNPADMQGTNLRVTVTDDGWFEMSTGGIDFYPQSVVASQIIHAEKPLPDYLAPAKVAALREGPVAFLSHEAKVLTSGAAEITYQLGKMGSNARAVLYYGTVDCITFVAGKPVNNSAAERDIYAPERVWQQSTSPQTAEPGTNIFRLTNLVSGKTYYYRLFVSHAEGKSWDAISGSFVAK